MFLFPALFYIVCSLFFLLSLNWIFRIVYGYKFIQKETGRLNDGTANRLDPIYVLIPVLAEVGRIEETVGYFIDTFSTEVNIKIVLITAESEFLYLKQNPNTIDTCKILAKKFCDIVVHCHYPREDGKMSHQLNYGIEKIIGGLEDDTLIAIYNADSKTHRYTFRWVTIQRMKDSSRSVFQQYGDYTKNVYEKTNSILLSAALWQNRWAMGLELFKALTALGLYDRNDWRRPVNYLIGHGLFISKGTYKKTSGFSEIFHNEDILLGLEVSFLK